MRHLDVRHKRTSFLPWLAGAVLLGLFAWGATTLLGPPEREEPVAVTVPEDTLPPTTIPRPPTPVDTRQPRGLHELAPLDVEHVGERVRAEGEVVATGTTGFWLAVGTEVVRIDSERLVQRGQTVALEGRIELLEDAGRTERIAGEVLARDPRAEEWRLVPDVKVVEAALGAG